MSRTFGFEAEFGTGVAALTERLHAEGLCGMQEPHSWHCDCHLCTFSTRNEYPFRVQTDSSCDGEVISPVMRSSRWADARKLMVQLQTLATDVDAEPSLRAGCHVHVNIDHLTEDEKHAAFEQFVRWEHVLLRVSAGRWANNREANTSVARAIRRYDAHSPAAEWGERFEHHFYSDRHSNLNLNTRHQTWEFRLWNSTRVAWRMELWARLSLAMTSMPTVEDLAEVDDDQVWDDSFLEVITRHNSVTGRLLKRQYDYLNKRAAEAPALLTV